MQCKSAACDNADKDDNDVKSDTDLSEDLTVCLLPAGETDWIRVERTGVQVKMGNCITPGF